MLPDDWGDDTVPLSKVADLVPAFAHAFADQADRALERGLLQGYVEIDGRFAPSHSLIRTKEIDDHESNQRSSRVHSDYPGEDT